MANDGHHDLDFTLSRLFAPDIASDDLVRWAGLRQLRTREPLDPATVGARLPELATAIERHRQEHADYRMQRDVNDKGDVSF